MARALRPKTKVARRLRRDAADVERILGFALRRRLSLAERGYRVLRFWNNEVLDNLDGVLEAILGALSSDPPPLTPPP